MALCLGVLLSFSGGTRIEVAETWFQFIIGLVFILGGLVGSFLAGRGWK